MGDNLSSLKIASAPAKDDILAMLDRVRADVERGEVLAIVIIPIGTDRCWATLSEGDIGMLELSGYLGRAWLTAMQAVGS
jgi:hypothetical protein